MHCYIISIQRSIICMGVRRRCPQTHARKCNTQGIYVYFIFQQYEIYIYIYNLPEHDEHDALDRQQLVERPQRRDEGVRLVVEEDLGITCVEVLHL